MAWHYCAKHLLFGFFHAKRLLLGLFHEKHLQLLRSWPLKAWGWKSRPPSSSYSPILGSYGLLFRFGELFLVILFQVFIRQKLTASWSKITPGNDDVLAIVVKPRKQKNVWPLFQYETIQILFRQPELLIKMRQIVKPLLVII